MVNSNVMCFDNYIWSSIINKFDFKIYGFHPIYKQFYKHKKTMLLLFSLNSVSYVYKIVSC